MEMKILAQQMGISHQMANRYKRRGMPCESLEAAQIWIKANINPFRSKAGRICGNSGMKPVSTETKEETSTLEELQDAVKNSKQLNLDGNDADELYKNSRALKEKSLALQAAAEHEKFVGSLVERDAVNKIIFERARQFRDGLIGCSRRIAPELINETNISVIEGRLNREFRQLLEQFARLPEIEN